MNWNGHEDTLACLHSLISAQPAPDAVVVCDNASTDNSLAIIAKKLKQKYNYQFVSLSNGWFEAINLHPAVVLIPNTSNLGFAAGNNPGIRYALKRNFAFIWLLNNDTVVYEDTLKHLLRCASTCSTADIWGSTIVYDNAPDKIQCAGGCTYNPVTTVFQPAFQGRSLDWIKNCPEPRLDYIYGASLFITRKVFETVGLLNELYFLFYEEIDLCRRAGRQGFAMGWCRPSIVRHKQGQSVSLMQRTGRPQIIAYHETLSTLIFTATYYPLILPLTLAVRFMGKLAAVMKRGEFHLIRPLMNAYKDFFRMLG
ncbi:MAG: glycosyltransferase family 2 protein [Desulfobacterales bacterium]